MPILSYSSPAVVEASPKYSLVVFVPIGVAIALYIACALWFQGATAALIILISLLAAEIVTIFFLWVWRRRLVLFSIIAGWVLVSLVALFLAFVAAANLGLIRE